MSGKTFNNPNEDQGNGSIFVAHRNRLLDCDSSYSLSLSPDSDRCNFNLSERGDMSTLSKGRPMSNPYNNEKNLLTNLENGFISTPDKDNSNINFWNDNLCVLSNQDSGAKQSFYKTASEGSSSSVIDPDSVGISSCSFSSAEMVVRNNSFCLEDQSPLVFSSLEESPAPLASCHVEPKLLLTPQLCEKDGSVEHTDGHPCLGTTFIYSGDKVELPSEDDLAMSNSLLALVSEKESLQATFICEKSPADCASNTQFFGPEAELTNESKTLDADEDIQTSTPVQNLGSNLSSLPSFTLSPCTENSGSPALHSVVRKQSSVTPKQFEKGLSSSGSKVTKMEINKFPKTVFNSIKSKLIPRAVASAKPPQINNKHEVPKVGSVRPSPTRVSNTTATSVIKTVQNTHRRPNLGANKDQTNLQNAQSASSAAVTEEVKAKSKPLAAALLKSDASKTPLVHCSPDTEQATTSQVNTANHTFCISYKSPQKSLTNKKTETPRNDLTYKMKKVKSGSTVGQHNSTPNTRPRSSSESSTALSRLLKIPRPQRFSASFTLNKTDDLKSQNKPGSQGSSSQSKPACTKEAFENNSRKVKKIGLAAESYTLAAASGTDSKSRFRPQASPNQARASICKAPAASPTPLKKHRVGISGRERTSSTVGTPLPKQKTTSNWKTTEETFHGPTAAASTKHQPSSSHLVQTPSRTSVMGPPPTPVSRLQQRKTFGSTRNQPETRAPSEVTDGTRAAQVSGVAGRSPTPFKAVALKARLTTTPAKTSGPVLTTSCKSTATTKGLPNGHICPQKRNTSSLKVIRLSAAVDKNKPKAASRPPQAERTPSKPHQNVGPRDGGPTGVSEGQRKDHKIQQLQAQLVQTNNKFVAFTLLLQRALDQRDEAVRQCRGLSQELVDLRGQLVSSVNESDRLQQEKEDLRAALQEAVEQVQDQHQRDLLELEQRLKESYQNEWTAEQDTYREEAERFRALLEQQMGELRVSHEVMKQDLEKSHDQHLQSVKEQYEHSLEDLRNMHTQELQSLDKTLKDAEIVLSEKIRELTRENDALMEKLKEEEIRRKEMSHVKSFKDEPIYKDSHTVYLEQELESLKVVLDIKNQQLHQQEKKLMEVDKLMEKNVKLAESLRKVQQENEDLKARMERHATLSRQLSSEQALLQESLQKESNVNKRLSMENEELLWKLHNGDLGSPRKVSSGPSSPFSLQSPRSPPLFSTTPLSPR